VGVIWGDGDTVGEWDEWDSEFVGMDGWSDDDGLGVEFRWGREGDVRDEAEGEGEDGFQYGEDVADDGQATCHEVVVGNVK